MTAIFDAPLVFVLGRVITSSLFRKLRWYLAGAACPLFAALWGAFGSVVYWDAVYHAIFPAWARWLLPVIYGLLYVVLASAFWQASIRARRWEAACFVVLVGLVSLPGHTLGNALGLMRVPMLILRRTLRDRMLAI